MGRRGTCLREVGSDRLSGCFFMTVLATPRKVELSLLTSTALRERSRQFGKRHTVPGFNQLDLEENYLAADKGSSMPLKVPRLHKR